MDRDALVRAPHSDLGDVGLADVPTRPGASFPAFRRVGPTDDPILSWSRQRCDRGAEDPWAGSGVWPAWARASAMSPLQRLESVSTISNPGTRSKIAYGSARN